MVTRMRLVQDQGSREQTDLSSEEAANVHAAELLSGEQVIHSRGDQMTGNGELKRKATQGKVDGSNDLSAPGPNSEQQDLDIPEDNNNGRPVGNHGDISYDGKSL